MALVSNGERLQELTEQAANAEDAATLQVLKTMDSISAKAQQLQTSLQGLYTEGGFENLYKNILDLAKNVIDTFTGMPKLFGNIPVAALAMFAQLFINIGGLVTNALASAKEKFASSGSDLSNKIETGAREGVSRTQQHANELQNIFGRAATHIQNDLANAISQGTMAPTNTLNNKDLQPIKITAEMSRQDRWEAEQYNSLVNDPTQQKAAMSLRN